jgi:hypothetical protein
MKKIQIVILFLGVGMACAACNLPQKGAQTLPAPQANPSLSPQATNPVRTAAVTPAATAGGQSAATASATQPANPGDPNDVVQAYLIAYPDDTAGMLTCLSSSLRAALPAGGPGMLLQAEGDVNGFIIQSGSNVPNPPQAVVLVALQAGGARLTRTFNLIQENNRWVINSITP